MTLSTNALAAWRVRLDELKTQVTQCTSLDDLDEIQKAMTTEQVQKVDTQIKDSKTSLRALRGLCGRISKQVDKLNKASASVAQAQPADLPSNAGSTLTNALNLMVTPIASGELPQFSEFGVARGFSKILPHMPALMTGDIIQKACSDIVKMPYFPKQQEWLHKHMKQHKKTYSNAAILEKLPAKAIADHLDNKLGVGTIIRNALPIPAEKSCLKSVYELQFYESVQGPVRPQCSPFCTAEARLVLQGCELIVGLRLCEVPGQVLLDKAKHLNDLAPNAFHELVQKVGFEVVLTEGSALVVPAGFLLMVATGSKGCSGLRWGLTLQFGDNIDTDIVQQTIEEMITAYPELTKGPLQDFRKHLDQYCKFA